MLLLQDGEIFATGAIQYDYRPVLVTETTNRIILNLRIEELDITTILDTGAPYFILSPKEARRLALVADPAFGRIRMLVRGMFLDGGLIRATVMIPADIGENLDVDTTIFIPDSEAAWGDFPSFIGLTSFLERIRFAIDPTTNQFYFGSL